MNQGSPGIRINFWKIGNALQWLNTLTKKGVDDMKRCSNNNHAAKS